jgi:nitroreductase
VSALDINEALAARRSIRQFRSAPVDRAIIERLVKAAASAPSARNEQPWNLYVTTGATRLELGRVVAQTTVYLREYVDSLGPDGYERAFTWYSSLGDAPVLVAVAVPESDDEFTSANRLLSVGAAIENLLLAATAEGLGACPFTFSYWVKSELAKTLGLPEGHTVVCVIALGWPASDEGTPRPAKRSDVAVWLD